MTEFNEKLRLELHRYKAENRMKMYEIADKCSIDRKTFYQFTAGNSGLNQRDTAALMQYLGLEVKLQEKS